MAGPWEKYAAPEPETPAGPWAKYAPAQAQPKTSVPLQGISGVNEGLAGFVGSPVEAAKGMATFGPVSTVKSLTDKVLGWLGMSEHAEAFDPLNAGGRKALDAAENAIPNPVGGVGQVAGAMQNAGMISDVSPQNFPQRMARRVGQEIGANAPAALGVAALPGKLGAGARASFPSYMAADMGVSVGSGTGAGLAEEAFPGNPMAEMIGRLAGGAAVGVPIAMGSASRARRNVREAVPSTDDLTRQAGGMYDDARATGATIPQPEVAKMVVDFEDIAKAEGIITPMGTVNRAFPKVAGALRQIEDYLTSPLTPDQVQTVRKTIRSVVKSTDAEEQRIGVLMMKRFDDVMDQASPIFREANKVYQRAMKGEDIQELINLSGLDAGQFTGSGFENALRKNFRAFAKKIERGTEVGWNAAEIEAIERVASGGKLENFFRDVGKAAPRGVVSAGLGGGTAFMVGNALGGPLAGTAAAGGTLMTGELGRRLATNLQTRNAEYASALARQGGPLAASPAITPQMKALAAALAGGQAIRGQEPQ